MESGPASQDVSKKPRFAFKKTSGTVVQKAKFDDGRSAIKEDERGGSSTPALPPTSDSIGDLSSTQVTLRDITRCRIDLDQIIASSPTAPSQCTGFSLVLENIEGCLIDLRQRDVARVVGSPRLTALYGANVRDSVVLVPEDMAGSLMLDRMDRVLVAAGCQQVR